MNEMVARAALVVGDLQSVSAQGVASGWCWSPQEPQVRRAVALLGDGQVLATALCDAPSEALRGVGVGDGAHAFAVAIPRAALPAEAGSVELQIEDLATGRRVGKPLAYRYEAAAPAPPPSQVRAALERAGEDGLISGWCWDPSAPARRVELAVLVDGMEVGTTVADVFRGDLVPAAIGDGAHAFSFLLPWDVVAGRSAAQIALRDLASGQVLAAAAMYRRPALVPVEERLRDVERQMRLLGARLEEAERRARRDSAMLSGVLGTIGAFFTRLAETPLEAAPVALVPSLPGLLAEVAGRLAPLCLAQSAAPELTLCVAADGTVEQVHACLAALHDAGVDRQAEIVLIDDGRCSGAALLTAVVQNLVWWRVQPGQSVPEARNRAVLSAGRAFAGFLSAGARVSADWLPALFDSFARLPGCAALGAKLVRADGTIAAAGLLPTAQGGLADFAAGAPALMPDCDWRRPVAAVDDSALLVRGAAFARLGGFDPALTDGAEAAAELCLRLWQAGEQVLYQPAAAVGWEGPEPAGIAVARAPWLAHRWFAQTPQGWPNEARPLALLLDGPTLATDGLDMGVAAAALNTLGWRVDFAVPGRLGLDDARCRPLRAAGVRVLRAPFQPTLAAALRNASEPYGLIVLTAAAAMGVSARLLRGLAPGARLVLALDRAAAAGLAAGRGAVAAAVTECDRVVAASAADAAALRAARPDQQYDALFGADAPGGQAQGVAPAPEPGADGITDGLRRCLQALGLPAAAGAGG